MIRFLFSAVLVAFSSVSSEAGLSINELLKAPQEIFWLNQKIVLTAGGWRDFMPLNPPEGSDLMVVVSIRNGPIFPTGVQAKRFWLIQDETIVEVTDFERQDDDFRLSGPKWPIGSQVTVVAELSSPKGTKLMRAPTFEITRTD